ncbi:hypothetical protein J2I47_05385 [Fibrella sp. HMF5335]|uniref:Uncharacterized protein n=1 Tax=Fibrella rubiginis TaxID=2817060 RepID=A0A939GGB0_9BACT|nr:hypothetical protein [Fibrella rubiginis]MBO0935972.1 hypothetical protein [Fibrella rubiginis]
MRYIKDLPHPQVKISLYSWNSKYIVKIEAGPYEQTYKIGEFDVTGPDDVESMISESFMASVLARFGEMDRDWSGAMSNDE